MKSFLRRLERAFDAFANILGVLSIVFLALLVIVVFYNVVARYLFPAANSVAMQELTWWLYSAMFLFGVSYALKENAHVRVDIFYEKFNPTAKALINILGTIFFILPFVALVAFFSIDYVSEAYTSHEASANPGGMQHLWIIKSAITLSYAFLFIYAFGFLIKNINALLDVRENKGSEFLSGNSSGAQSV